MSAVWKENIYNINIDSNGGYDAGSTIITGYEKENELPDPPLRPGYDFDSWNTEEDGKGTKYENKDVVSKLVEDDGGNMTIYAQWKKKKKLCLKVSSNSYLKSLINPAAEALAKWILKIGQGKDLTINLNHIMNFGEDSFEAKILNTGEVVHDMLDFIKIAGQYVSGGTCKKIFK